MTTVCGGGTSQPRTGYASNISASSSAISDGIIAMGYPEAAAALSLLIGGLTLYLPTYCATDPPADPGISPTDVADALNVFSPQISGPAILKIEQWFSSWYWYTVCECASVTTPSAPTPSDPGGVTQNPGLPGGPNGTCFDNNYTATMNTPGSGVTIVDATPALLPTSGSSVTGSTVIGSFSGVTANYWPFPPGITHLDVLSKLILADDGLGSAEHLVCAFYTGDSSGTMASSQQVAIADQSGASTTPIPHPNAFVWPAASTTYGISCVKPFSVHSTGVAESVTMEAVGTCNGPALQPECCPPDPAITNKLDQIYRLLLNTYSIVPVQPHTYAVGASHGGLTGGGTQSLDSHTTAIQVTIDTFPDVYGTIAGTPTTYIDVGWITPVTAQGATAGLRVSRGSQVFVLPEATESVDYTFQPGESVTITELQPG